MGGLFRGLTALFTVFFLLFTIVTYYATGTYQAKVDELLGTNSGAVEHSTDIADYKFQSDYETVEDLAAAEAELVERIEEEGAVLLKGTVDDITVGSGAAVTLFGIRSYKLHYGGTIGAVTNTSPAVSLDEALEERGISVNQDMVTFYKGLSGSYTTTSTTTAGEVPQSEYEAVSLDYSGYQDAAIIVLGRVNSEGATYLPGEDGIDDPWEFSQSTTGNILGLSDDEKDLVSYVKEQGFSKIIVLINSSSMMEIEELKEDGDIDAIMLIGNPGAYGTYGIADILTGEAVPSGHLSDTIAVNSALSPAAQDFDSYEYANSEETYSAWYEVEEEGIYVGYKYYETRYYDTVMGYGNAQIAGKNETADGSDVWDYDNEVSYTFGYGVEGSTFSEEVTDFSSYDSNYSHDGVEGAYILEAGTYYFATGNGAHDAVNAVIRAQDETKPEDVEITGTVFSEELEETVAFTVGLDGETLIQNQLEDMDFTYEEYGDAFTGQGRST